MTLDFGLSGSDTKYWHKKRRIRAFEIRKACSVPANVELRMAAQIAVGKLRLIMQISWFQIAYTINQSCSPWLTCGKAGGASAITTM